LIALLVGVCDDRSRLLEGATNVRIENRIGRIRDNQVVARVEPDVLVVKGTPLRGLRNLAGPVGYLRLENVNFWGAPSNICAVRVNRTGVRPPLQVHLDRR